MRPSPAGVCSRRAFAAVAAFAVLTARVDPLTAQTPKTKLPQWLLDSEYFQDPKLMYAEEVPDLDETR